MQSVSTNYAIAASGAGGTWADPQLKADWFSDGFSTPPSRPTATLILRDSFDRTVIDGLGYTPSGRAWTNTGGNANEYAVAGGFATHTHPTVNVLHASIVEFGDSDFDLVCTVRIPVAAATGATITALW